MPDGICPFGLPAGQPPEVLLLPHASGGARHGAGTQWTYAQLSDDRIQVIKNNIASATIVRCP